jgi:hypothetical protein
VILPNIGLTPAPVGLLASLAGLSNKTEFSLCFKISGVMSVSRKDFKELVIKIV